MSQARICLGFGAIEGRCANVAGTPWTMYWCAECDKERRAHITEQMKKLVQRGTAAERQGFKG